MSEQPGRRAIRPESTTPDAGSGPAGAPAAATAQGSTDEGSAAKEPASTGPVASRDTSDHARPTHGFDSRGKVRTTRAGAWWTALVLAAVLSILILVFIVQNGESVVIKFLGFEGELPLAVSLLAAAVAGALVVAIPGIFRIIQLRRALTRNAKES